MLLQGLTLVCMQAGDTALTRSERLLSYWQQYKPLTRTIKVHVQEAFQLPIPSTSCMKVLTCNTTKPKVQSQIIGVYPEEQPSCAPLPTSRAFALELQDTSTRKFRRSFL